MIRLSIVSVGMVEDTGSVIIVLRADESARLLVMEIGLLEGRSIAMEAEGIKAPRPLTHDLMHQFIQGLGARVADVRIRDFQEQTFFATVVLERQDGTLTEFDARPSDAIALALRAGAPIYASEEVMAVAAIDEDDVEEESASPDESEEEEEEEEEEDDGEDPVVH
ncbi:MAG TPA: bifunctional nuclease family protein [Symbiobacteriaceae bacterium]|nr:bifunctional nuclease family protein [Symbiobacteriaceae bacterium]